MSSEGGNVTLDGVYGHATDDVTTQSSDVVPVNAVALADKLELLTRLVRVEGQYSGLVLCDWHEIKIKIMPQAC